MGAAKKKKSKSEEEQEEEINEDEIVAKEEVDDYADEDEKDEDYEDDASMLEEELKKDEIENTKERKKIDDTEDFDSEIDDDSSENKSDEMEETESSNDKKEETKVSENTSQAQDGDVDKKTEDNVPASSLPQKEMTTKIKKWLSYQGWKSNPFVLNIIPSVFVGYENEKSNLISCIEQNHKVFLILGATGSGKTTMLRWLAEELENDERFATVFISKPPATVKEFIDILNREFFSLPWFLFFLRPFMPHIKNISSVSDVLNERFRDKRLVMLCDEVHESNVEVLQWLRVIADQVDNMSLVLSGLPIFESILKEKLETLQKRITSRISLSALTKEETRELIIRRISYVAATPEAKNPFSEAAIEKIYRETGGFPREILRACDKAVSDAIAKGVYSIGDDSVPLSRHEARRETSTFNLGFIPKRQREIIEAIRKGRSTPSEIIASIDMSNYKSSGHALRSVNNILQRLMKEGLIEREKHGKTFIYTLGPKLRSMTVSA